ncbi:MAG: hypothetical protein WDM80_04025 [Limisphaerales bacterium]
MNVYRTWFVRIIFLTALLLTISLAYFFLYYPIRRHWLIHKSAPVILRIENYHSKQGTLPPNLSAVEIEENPFHYQKQGETNYIVWFGEQLGESVAYDSNRKSWR